MKGRQGSLPSWSPELARIALSGHSMLGLCFGALLYLICLTGTLSVFAEELRSWEAPFGERTEQIPPGVAGRLLTNVMRDASAREITDVILRFPTSEHPYGILYLYHEYGRHRHAVGADGRMSEPLHTPWTNMLTQLHANLHMRSFGSLVVGFLGLFLLSSMLTGLVAHRKILLDAFCLRRSGSPGLFQADIHNRLGAWGLPFHALIALTGAFIALTPLLLQSAVWTGYADEVADLQAVYAGNSPRDASLPATLPNIASILARMEEIAPSEAVEHLIVHDPGAAGQSIAVETDILPQLAYAEVHRFSPDGAYLGARHYADGPLGLQFFASTGSLHFGLFGMLTLRLVYGLLGLALTVCCVSGINIWLKTAIVKGRPLPGVERLWRAFIWGVPLALTLSAVVSLVYDAELAGTFYATLTISLFFGLVKLDVDMMDRFLRSTLAILLLITSVAFSFLRTEFEPTPVNFIVGFLIFASGAVLAFSVPTVRRGVLALTGRRAV